MKIMRDPGGGNGAEIIITTIKIVSKKNLLKQFSHFPSPSQKNIYK